jgi:hypothetical protein
MASLCGDEKIDSSTSTGAGLGGSPSARRQNQQAVLWASGSSTMN